MPTAHVFQINASDGGVPKLPLARAEITENGLAGDRQNDLKNHGGPERAVCLYSLERILALQEEGHPIVPGAAGENLTLTGVDWEALQPGMTLRLGADVVIELTRYTEPCGKIGGSFTGRNHRRVLQDEHPGWSRFYARVLRGGSVCVGDPVEIG